jgi:hypothetical protein
VQRQPWVDLADQVPEPPRPSLIRPSWCPPPGEKPWFIKD